MQLDGNGNDLDSNADNKNVWEVDSEDNGDAWEVNGENGASDEDDGMATQSMEEHPYRRSLAVVAIGASTVLAMVNGSGGAW